MILCGWLVSSEPRDSDSSESEESAGMSLRGAIRSGFFGLLESADSGIGRFLDEGASACTPAEDEQEASEVDGSTVLGGVIGLRNPSSETSELVGASEAIFRGRPCLRTSEVRNSLR